MYLHLIECFPLTVSFGQKPNERTYEVRYVSCSAHPKSWNTPTEPWIAEADMSLGDSLKLNNDDLHFHCHLMHS